MTSARKAATASQASRSIRDRFALLLALAEARLDYALWRQAYRRIGWHPRGVALEVFPPSIDWSCTQKRLRDFAHAFRNMNQIVDSYVDHIRERFGIGKTDLVAHGSTDARLRRAAHHELVTASPFALILSSARSARPSKDERGHAHARGPPTSPKIANHPPRRLHLRDRIRMPVRARSPAESHNGLQAPLVSGILRRRRHGACRPVRPALRCRLRRRPRPHEMRCLSVELPRRPVGRTGRCLELSAPSTLPAADLASAELSLPGPFSRRADGAVSTPPAPGAFSGYWDVIGKMGDRAPRTLAIENVGGLLSSHGGRELRQALDHRNSPMRAIVSAPC